MGLAWGGSGGMLLGETEMELGIQGIFLTQGSNPGLPHCREMLLCHLSYQGSIVNGSHYL